MLLHKIYHKDSVEPYLLVTVHTLVNSLYLIQKIKELIRVLDQRNDESTERTFKGVNEHFGEVFSKLVQGGRGYLVMMEKKDGEPRQADVERRVGKYSGVEVQVSFTEKGELQSMTQLSLDQKTLVAMTLIFAIHNS
ncbi:Structural maintenance of chromosomes protein 3 [Linum perenne]